MQIVTIYNPYFEKTYKVVESKGDIEQTLMNITKGNERFLHLHDFETGNPICVSPENCASVEVTETTPIEYKKALEQEPCTNIPCKEAAPYTPKDAAYALDRMATDGDCFSLEELEAINYILRMLAEYGEMLMNLQEQKRIIKKNHDDAIDAIIRYSQMERGEDKE